MADSGSDNERQEGAAGPAPAEEEAPPAPPATAGVGGGAPGIATPRNPDGPLLGGGTAADPAGTGTGETSTGGAQTGSAERGGR